MAAHYRLLPALIAVLIALVVLATNVQNAERPLTPRDAAKQNVASVTLPPCQHARWVRFCCPCACGRTPALIAAPPVHLNPYSFPNQNPSSNPSCMIGVGITSFGLLRGGRWGSEFCHTEEEHESIAIGHFFHRSGTRARSVGSKVRPVE